MSCEAPESNSHTLGSVPRGPIRVFAKSILTWPEGTDGENGEQRGPVLHGSKISHPRGAFLLMWQLWGSSSFVLVKGAAGRQELAQVHKKLRE